MCGCQTNEECLRVHCAVLNARTSQFLVRHVHRVTAVMARGKRPVPFRTRKLSLSAPMVLPWRRGGRVGRRRTTIPEGAPASVLGPLSVMPWPGIARHRALYCGDLCAQVSTTRAPLRHVTEQGPESVRRSQGTTRRDARIGRARRRQREAAGSPTAAWRADWSANQLPTAPHASSQEIEDDARPPKTTMRADDQPPGAGLPPALVHDHADPDADEGEGQHRRPGGEDLQRGVVDLERSGRPEGQSAPQPPVAFSIATRTESAIP